MSEDKFLPYASLLLRLALAFSLLSGVADRLGFWGEPGAPNIRWGDWFGYVSYTHMLLAFASRGVADKMALLITVFEVCFALMLLFGLKVKWAAVGTGAFLFVYTIGIAAAFGVKNALDSFLPIACAASLLLACLPVYKWTVNGIKKKTIYRPY